MPFEELKARQSVVWGAGAYEPIVEITTEIHEALVAALDGRPGQGWLDIATGTGAVALRAARTGAEVTGVDLAPALIQTARRNAAAQGLNIRFETGDAEALPYQDASFDIVSSAIGTQFAPDHRAVARELGRVCRPGGRLGLACWTPTGGVAEMFKMMAPFMPPPALGSGMSSTGAAPTMCRSCSGTTSSLVSRSTTRCCRPTPVSRSGSCSRRRMGRPRPWPTLWMWSGESSYTGTGSSCTRATGSATRSSSPEPTC
jgi:SAM-dependent methyltransferase